MGDGDLQYSVVQSLVEAVLVDTSVSVDVYTVLKEVPVFVETSNVVVVTVVDVVSVDSIVRVEVGTVTTSVEVY